MNNRFLKYAVLLVVALLLVQVPVGAQQNRQKDKQETKEEAGEGKKNKEVKKSNVAKRRHKK